MNKNNETTNENWREEFYKRYHKSAIYHEMYVDWFPDDVMQFIKILLSQEKKALLDRVDKEIEKGVAALKDTVKAFDEYDCGYIDAAVTVKALLTNLRKDI